MNATKSRRAGATLSILIQDSQQREVDSLVGFARSFVVMPVAFNVKGIASLSKEMTAWARAMRS